jgi:hypothetical protein
MSNGLSTPSAASFWPPTPTNRTPSPSRASAPAPGRAPDRRRRPRRPPASR